jgi:hypothetical protein
MPAPDHHGEIIPLIDNVLGNLGSGHDASRPAVLTPSGAPVSETHDRADSSIVCRPSGGTDWMVAVSLRHVTRDSLRPGVEIIIDFSKTPPKPQATLNPPKPLPNRR